MARTRFGLQYFAGNYSHSKEYATTNWMCKCGLEREEEGHIISGQCKVYSDLRVKFGDLKEDKNLVMYFQAVLDRRDTMDEEDRRLALLNMCPADLHERIIKEGDKYDSYHKARSEIFEAIAISRRPKGAVRQIGAVEATSSGGGEEYEGEQGQWEDLDDEEMQYV